MLQKVVKCYFVPLPRLSYIYWLIHFKKRTAHSASYTFLREMLINIETRHFHSSINHQEHLFHRPLITSYLRRVNIIKQLFYRNLQTQSFEDVFQTGVHKNFANFTGKRLCWKALESLFKTFAGWRPATLLKKDSDKGAFLWSLQNF